MNQPLSGRRATRDRWFLPAALAAGLLALLVALYEWIDPLPPRQLTIAGRIAGTPYDATARRYAETMARSGVALEVRNYAGATEHFAALRDPRSGVQAAITGFGFTNAHDEDTLASLGGISDSPIFIFYRGPDPVTRFAQMKGRRLSIGMPTTALRALMLEVLKVTEPTVADLGEAPEPLEEAKHMLDLGPNAGLDAVDHSLESSVRLPGRTSWLV